MSLGWGAGERFCSCHAETLRRLQTLAVLHLGADELLIHLSKLKRLMGIQSLARTVRQVEPNRVPQTKLTKGNCNHHA